MNKKLPSVFANRKEKHENNNIEQYYSKEKTIDKKANNLNNKMNNEIKSVIIMKKINDIFYSNNFVYKAKVVITTKEGDKITDIIAKNNDSLLTLNNEVILIKDIIDIKKV